MSVGDFPESLSQAMLVGVMLVGALGVEHTVDTSVRLDRAPLCTAERLGRPPWNLSGSCRCALTGVPCRLRMLGIFRTVDNMLKLTISPQAKRAETDPRQGTPTRAHLQPPELMDVAEG